MMINEHTVRQLKYTRTYAHGNVRRALYPLKNMPTDRRACICDVSVRATGHDESYKVIMYVIILLLYLIRVQRVFKRI
jgi:hypothetical protein